MRLSIAARQLPIQHTFLIVDPKLTLRSLYAQWPTFTFSESRYEAQHIFYERVSSLSGTARPVIKAEDLERNPALTVGAYCKAMGSLLNLKHSPGHREGCGNWAISRQAIF